MNHFLPASRTHGDPAFRTPQRATLSEESSSLYGRHCAPFTPCEQLRHPGYHHQRSKMICRSTPTPSSQGGLRLLEWTGDILPQAQLVKTAKFGWQQLWLTFMRELAPQSSTGAYTRPSYTFRNRIGDPEFPVEADRYVLYLGGPCPWCHRVALALALRGLGDAIKVVRAVDAPERASRGGWVFDGAGEPYFGCRDLREVYDICVPGFTGRCTAPLLVDIVARKAVCNESAIIVQNLDEISFPRTPSWIQLRPAHLVKQIEAMNEQLHDAVNNGVYRCGFATTQRAYEEAEGELFASLTELDALLSQSRFLCGDRFTEADLRLFPTAARFDAVYALIFKCCRRRWQDFPSLNAWFKDCAQLPLPNGGRLLDTVDIDDCRRSYHVNLFPINPGGIVPRGPSVGDLGLDQIEVGRGSQQGIDVYWRGNS